MFSVLGRLAKSASRSGAHQFRRDEAGSVAVIFSLTAIVVLSLVGGAIDYGRAVHARYQIQEAVDSAVLAAARVWQTQNDIILAKEKGLMHYNNNKPQTFSSQVSKFTPDFTANTISMEAEGVVPTPFLSMVRITGYTVGAFSQARLQVGENADHSIEVGMMLDITGSMSGQKIVDLKAAAKDFIDIVVWQDQSQYTSKVAIAPFAPRVNVGNYITAVTGMPATKSGGRRIVKCVTERTGLQAATDAAPGALAYLNAFDGTRNQNNTNYTNNGNCNDPSEQIMPLTNDKVALKARVDSFTAGGATAGQLGTAWAWYLLSPNWASLWPSANRPVAYGTPKLDKIAVLMTDGIYNTLLGQSYGDYSAQAATAATQAIALCTGMKAKGIIVYSILFEMDGVPGADGVLKACASSPEKFYNAADGAELRLAFRDIALQISKLSLSQ